MVEDNEQDLDVDYSIPPRTTPYSFLEQQVCTVNLQSAAQNCKLTNNLFDFNMGLEINNRLYFFS